MNQPRRIRNSSRGRASRGGGTRGSRSPRQPRLARAARAAEPASATVADIPEVVIERLPVYARAVQRLAAAGREVVSSQELGAQLGVTPAQIRKDLSYFGRFGKQGRGYNVERLSEELRQILGLDRSWSMALIGVGHLGKAILHYGGFGPQGFHVVAAFDNDPATIGQQIAGLRVQDVRDLPQALAAHPVDIGIVAVPAAQAPAMIDLLVASGVRAILNYAPIAAHVPPDVHVRSVDPVLALQSMTFYVKQHIDAK